MVSLLLMDQLEGDFHLILAGVFESRGGSGGVKREKQWQKTQTVLDSHISVELFQYEAKP